MCRDAGTGIAGAAEAEKQHRVTKITNGNKIVNDIGKVQSGPSEWQFPPRAQQEPETATGTVGQTVPTVRERGQVRTEVQRKSSSLAEEVHPQRDEGKGVAGTRR